MARITDWTGISETPTGYLVRVQVRPLPWRAKRYPKGTTLATMQKWRDDTRAALETKRKRQRDAGKGLAEDARAYLSRWGAGKHPETVSQRTRHLEQWADAFPGVSRRDLTTSEIEQQLATWQREQQESAATWNKRRQALYQLYAVLDRGTDHRNPVADVPTQQEPKPTARGLGYDDVRDLLAAMPASATQARLGVMAFCGLRPEEVRRIQPDDISWAAGTLYVRSAKGSPAATIPLLPDAVTWLRALVDRDGLGPFTSAPMNRSLQRAIKRVNRARLIAGRAPLPPGITAYTMRHSFGTAYYRATRDVKSTKEAIRHASITMTERYVEGAVSEVVAVGFAALTAVLGDQQRDQHGRDDLPKSAGNRKVTQRRSAGAEPSDSRRNPRGSA